MSETIVLGAGMVGVGTALALRERGHAVVLLDRRAPGEETSHGNAGIIQTEAAEPMAMPRGFSELVRIALGRTNDVSWSIRSLPEHLRPLISYYRYSSSARLRRQSEVYSELTRRAFDDHEPLIDQAGASSLIREGGFRCAFRSERLLEAEALRAERLRREYGVPFAALDGAALARAEPALRIHMAGAVHWTEPRTCLDPGALVTAYARLFEQRGGTIARGDGKSLRQQGAGWAVDAADGVINAENVVVALGPWSAMLLAGFGYRVPLFRKRGYHWHVKPIEGPSLSIMDTERGAFMAVMKSGIRVATGAELTGFDAPANLRQINNALIAARELFRLGETIEPAPWFGSRPCLPDMLPLVGKAPSHKGLWLNFGHGHQGFTLGPTTGILLADMMSGRPVPRFTERLGFRW